MPSTSRDQSATSDQPTTSHDTNLARDVDHATAEKFCILGAGSSGLTVAKNFRAAGIAFDCLEREDNVGGNWYFGRATSSVYRSTRLISSKSLTEYTDYPMPEHYPDHPDQDMVWRYLRSYAEHFDLTPHIEFNAAVKSIQPATEAGGTEQGARSVSTFPAPCSPLPATGGWIVTLDSGQQRRYRGVVIANGHNWDPRWPEYPGKFSGEVLHSSQYKTPDVLRGNRVLVVGGGNSGYDIAAESARHATTTTHSLRRRYPLLPRFFRGRPVDQGGEWMLGWRLPLWLRRMSIARVCRSAWPSQLAPPTDHAFFETHPAINGRWPLDVHRGAIVTKPDVQELCGREVLFTDGSRGEFDLIIHATGFNISFPFLDVEQLNWRAGRPDLFLNIFHRQRDDLFIAGLIQPDSGQFGLVDYQAQLIAAYIQRLTAKHRGAVRLQSAKRTQQTSTSGGVRYINSPRHQVEVEHFSYRRTLNRWIRRLC